MTGLPDRHNQGQLLYQDYQLKLTRIHSPHPNHRHNHNLHQRHNDIDGNPADLNQYDLYLKSRISIDYLHQV